MSEYFEEEGIVKDEDDIESKLLVQGVEIQVRKESRKY